MELTMKSIRFALGLLVALLCLSGAALAQDTGTFIGTVHDTTGATVVGAEVTIVTSSIGENKTVTTNSDGDWVVPYLPNGSYNIVIVSKGFKKYEAKGVVLRVGQKARIDVTLEVGAISNEVIVAGEGLAQVETQSAQVGGTITGTEITQLELKGRDFAQLITLTPGVNNQSGQDEGTVGIAGNVIYSVNGGRGENNNWELDGGDNMDNGSNNSLNVYPSVDSIQEVRVLTSNYGAEYGRNASGTVETELKSGTTSFHGEVYESTLNNFSTIPTSFTRTRKPPPTKRMILDTPSADPFSFPAITTRTRARPSFSGRRNGAWSECPILLASRYLPTRSALEISAMYAPIKMDHSRIAPSCPAGEPKWRISVPTLRPSWPKSTLPTIRTDRIPALPPLALATTPPLPNRRSGAKNCCGWTTIFRITCAACFTTFTIPGIPPRRRRCGRTRRCPRSRQNSLGPRPAPWRG